MHVRTREGTDTHVQTAGARPRLGTEIKEVGVGWHEMETRGSDAPVHTCVCACMQIYTRTHAPACPHTYTRVHEHTQTHLNAPHLHLFTHTHIYIYPHIYTHIHGPMHTQTHTDTKLHVSPTHTHIHGAMHTRLYIHTRTPAHPPHVQTRTYRHLHVHTHGRAHGHRHACMCAHMCVASVVGAGCGATLGLCPGRGDCTSEAGNSLLPQNSAGPPSSTTGDGLGGSGLCSPPGRMEGGVGVRGSRRGLSSTHTGISLASSLGNKETDSERWEDRGGSAGPPLLASERRRVGVWCPAPRAQTGPAASRGWHVTSRSQR